MELVVRAKLIELEKEMEVGDGSRPALFDNQANLRAALLQPWIYDKFQFPGGKKDARDPTLMHRGWLVRQHSASRERLLHASIPVDPEMLDGVRVTYSLALSATMIYADRCDGSFEIIQP